MRPVVTQFPQCAGGKMMETYPKEGMTHELVPFHHTIPSSLGLSLTFVRASVRFCLFPQLTHVLVNKSLCA